MTGINTDWNQHDVFSIDGMLAPEDGQAMKNQAQRAWWEMRDLLDWNYHRLKAHRDALAGAWNSAGGQHYLTYVDQVLTSIENARETAARNWVAVHSMAGHLEETKPKIADIKRRAEQAITQFQADQAKYEKAVKDDNGFQLRDLADPILGGPEKPASLDSRLEPLHREARQAMSKLTTDYLTQYRQNLWSPPPYVGPTGAVGATQKPSSGASWAGGGDYGGAPARSHLPTPDPISVSLPDSTLPDSTGSVSDPVDEGPILVGGPVPSPPGPPVVIDPVPTPGPLPGNPPLNPVGPPLPLTGLDRPGVPVRGISESIRPQIGGRPATSGTGAPSAARTAPPVLGGQAGTAKASGLKGAVPPPNGEVRNRTSSTVLGGGAKNARRGKSAKADEAQTRGRASSPVLGRAAAPTTQSPGGGQVSLSGRAIGNARGRTAEGGSKVLGRRVPSARAEGEGGSALGSVQPLDGAGQGGLERGPAGRPGGALGAAGDARALAGRAGASAAKPQRKSRRATPEPAAPQSEGDADDVMGVERAVRGVLGPRNEPPAPTDAGPAIGR